MPHSEQSRPGAHLLTVFADPLVLKKGRREEEETGLDGTYTSLFLKLHPGRAPRLLVNNCFWLILT